MKRVSDWIMGHLADLGVRHIFMLPGGGAMHLNDALFCEPRITPVHCHHEQACGIAAEAYGRTGNTSIPNFGVTLVTTGPGATNLITPVTGAWIDSIPLLVISGQVKSTDILGDRPLRQSGVQEVDIMKMVSGITKYSATVEHPDQIKDILSKAIYYMLEGRCGPAWVEVPLDVQGALVDPDLLTNYSPTHSCLANYKESLLESSASVISRINSSSRPLVLAGHGVRLSGAAQIFRKFIEKSSIPVVSTWNAIDLLEYDHPCYVGTPGVVALRAPNFAIQNCDLLISIGCRADNVITAYDTSGFARNAYKVFIDIDQNELARLSPHADLCVRSDAKDFLAILSSLRIDQQFDVKPWSQQCQDWKQRFTVGNEGLTIKSGPISHYQLVAELSSIIPEEQLISTGSSGLAIETFYSTFQVKRNQRVFLTSGLGSMGYGLPAAIGACLGMNSCEVVALESDGSLMLNIQELATLKGLDLPIKLIVMDNNGYASIRNTQRNYYDSRYIASGPSSGLFMPSFKRIAESYQIHCIEISEQSQLRSSLEEFFALPGPAMCIVHLDQDETLAPKVSALPQEDGSILSMPLEDSFPLLSIDQLNNEMLVPLNPASYRARGSEPPT